uniref:Uncharacterized protein n=1 Tax=Daphnia galeata TaxID=27404 RepID=A0A8J2RP72_9CRUS|nr:unnamed protein product [Daphnia galeata]
MSYYTPYWLNSFRHVTDISVSLYCTDDQTLYSGYIDGSHSTDVESFWGKLVNKARKLWNVKTSVDPTEGTKSIYDRELVTIEERQGGEINGSFIGEATIRSSSCAIASVPCSCTSATGTCACASTGLHLHRCPLYLWRCC